MRRDVKVLVPVALGARNLLRNLRTPLLITASLLQPVIWLVLFSQIFRGLADTQQFRGLGYDSYLEFFVPGMVVLSMLFTALQSGMATITDIDTGMMDKLLISPIRRSSILLGRVLADAITMLLQGAIILGVALGLGARPQTGWLGALGMLAFAALFLTPAFFPEPLLPGWLQQVARGNPAAYVIQTGQQLMNIGNDWGQDLQTLLALALAGLVLIPAAVAAFRAAAR